MILSSGRLRSAILFLAAAMFAVAGCSVLDDDSRESEEEAYRKLLQQQRQVWEAEGYDSYRYRYQFSRGGEDLGVFAITVENGEVTEATVGGHPVQNEENERTIEDLFDEVRQAIEADTRQFGVRFNQEQGYLRLLTADYRGGGLLQIIVAEGSLVQIGGEEQRGTVAAE